MNLQEIDDLARIKLDDVVGKDKNRLWKEWELASYATDAESEVARLLFLLNDSDTIGYLKLSGIAGQIDTVSVSGVTVTSSPVSFMTDLATTAAMVARNINAYTTSPRYRAYARGHYVFIKAVPGTGFPAIGYLTSASASAGLAAAATNLAGLCRLVAGANQRYLQLHEKVNEITRVKVGGQNDPIKIYTKPQMDALETNWEARASGEVEKAVVDYDSGEIILVPPPSAACVIEMDCYRGPLFDLSVTDLSAAPEISSKYHLAMVDRMLKLAFEKNDVETLDLSRSQTADRNFKGRIEEFKRERNRRLAATEIPMNRPSGAFT